jgi:hypothetical protein
MKVKTVALDEQIKKLEEQLATDPYLKPITIPPSEIADAKNSISRGQDAVNQIKRLSKPTTPEGFAGEAASVNNLLSESEGDLTAKVNALTRLKGFLGGVLHTTGWKTTPEFDKIIKDRSIDMQKLASEVIDPKLMAADYNRKYIEEYDSSPGVRHMRPFESSYRMMFTIEPGTNKAIFDDYLYEPEATRRYGTSH